MRKNTAGKRMEIETDMEEKFENDKAQVDSEVKQNKGKGKSSSSSSVND